MGVTLRMFQSLASMSNAATQIVNSHVHLDAFYQLERYKVSTLRENYVIKNEPSNNLAIRIKKCRF